MNPRRAPLALLLCGSAVTIPTPAATQSPLSFEGRAGAVIPVGDLDGVADPGATVAVSLTRFLVERVGVRAGVSAAFLNDHVDAFGVVPSPPLTFVTFEGGFELDIPPPRYQQFPFSVRLRIMGGGTYVRGSAEYGDGTAVEVDEIRPTVAGGFALGYRPSDRFEVFVDGLARLVILSEEITGVFAQRSRQVEPFERAWSLPLAMGVRLR